VVVVNRTASRAEAAAALAGSLGRVGTLADVGSADVVVNATPLGMATAGGSAAGAGAGAEAAAAGAGAEAAAALAHALSGAGQVVVDLVYHPLDTPLLVAAAERGATTVDGLGMLVRQAARAFTLWTGVEAPLHVMRGAARAVLDAGRAEPGPVPRQT
jgi:shikimate dehydrogenase